MNQEQDSTQKVKIDSSLETLTEVLDAVITNFVRREGKETKCQLHAAVCRTWEVAEEGLDMIQSLEFFQLSITKPCLHQ